MNEKQTLYELLKEKEQRIKENRIFHNYFQDNTPLSIEHYQKHYEYFKAGLTAKQVMMIAANRIGKTESCGLYEIVCHAIGWYPNWWPGKKYPPGKNLTIWIAGDTNKTIRDILQKKLLYAPNTTEFGTGLIPKKYIQRITKAGGVAELIDTIFIDRIGGGLTQIQLKSYQQGRETFQGTEVDIILLDEEPPQSIYVECLMRTATNNGVIDLTFTPLRGMTQMISDFEEGAKENKSMKIITATWDDVPHLSPEAKAELLAGIPEWQRDARTKGIPQLGSGAIYRVSLDDILVKPFELPEHWKKAYALDVGWNATVAIWGAQNPDDGVIYLYSEMYEKQKQPHEYARTIKLRGDWIHGLVDSASNNANQHDGQKIFEMLKAEGLHLQFPDKSVEAGIYKVWEALSNGKLKIFNTLPEWQREYKIYQRDDKGKVRKKDDHLMDAMRYLIMSFDKVAKNKKDLEKKEYKMHNFGSGGWMA